MKVEKYTRVKLKATGQKFNHDLQKLYRKQIKELLSELLQNIDQLRSGQVDYINSVNKFFKRYKRISDKQLIILKDIRAELNEKCTTEASEIINEKFSDVQNIAKKI